MRGWQGKRGRRVQGFRVFLVADLTSSQEALASFTPTLLVPMQRDVAGEYTTSE